MLRAAFVFRSPVAIGRIIANILNPPLFEDLFEPDQLPSQILRFPVSSLSPRAEGKRHQRQLMGKRFATVSAETMAGRVVSLTGGTAAGD